VYERKLFPEGEERGERRSRDEKLLLRKLCTSSGPVLSTGS